ncbi:MAG: hypothetical protein HQM00_02440 [Magnetococcales bacterium]|nr:hypothetical protein [Magnetococcales bacterium]
MDKRRILLSLLIGLACARPDDGAAFTVGEIAVLSPPTKKFRAEIPLRLGEGETIKLVRLGNATDYKVMGLARSGALDGITVKTVDNGPETRVYLTSDQPLTSKGFDLLLRITSSKHTNFPVFRVQPNSPSLTKGELAQEAPTAKTGKETTQSASPEPTPQAEKPATPAPSGDASPAEATKGASEKEKLAAVNKYPGSSTPENKSTTENPAAAKAAKTLEELTTSTNAAAAKTLPPTGKTPPAPAPTTGGARSYGPVKVGDTLTSIARSLQPGKGVSLQQLMAAIYERNPEHFLSGNMNNLISGGILKVPSMEEVRAINDRQARIMCMAHTKAWEQMQAGQNVPPPPQNVLLAAAHEGAKPAPVSEAVPEPKTASSAALKETPLLSTPQSQLQSIAPPGGGGGLENILVRLQGQLGELTEILKTSQMQQVKLESRVSNLELARSDNEALSGRVAALEKALRETVPGSMPASPAEGSSPPFGWLGAIFALAGLLVAGGLAWLGRRWNRQAQQDGLKQLLAVTAKEYPEVARDILRQITPNRNEPFIPSIHSGKLDGVPPPPGKKVVNGDLLNSVNRLNAMDAGRGETK